MVLQCTATILKEQIKLCLSCEGFGNRLCFLETTSNAQVCLSHSELMKYSLIFQIHSILYTLCLFRMFLLIWQYAALSWSSLYLCGPFRKCWLTQMSLMRFVQSTYIRNGVRVTLKRIVPPKM